nr:hypothetical protein [Borreliella kurtenbachii]WKC86713.1 hypothetical protein QIA22_00215 [Borreliella kurtenbachii]
MYYSALALEFGNFNNSKLPKCRGQGASQPGLVASKELRVLEQDTYIVIFYIKRIENIKAIIML